MGAFQVDCELQELTGKQPPVRIAGVMVDTGSEYTWLPEQLLAQAGIGVSKKDLAFVMANGARITRDVGYAYLRSSGFETVDEVVFARPGDPRLLGARTIEGFEALVDARRKRLVASGPLPVAVGLIGSAPVTSPAQDHALWKVTRASRVAGAQLPQHGQQRVADQRVDLVDQKHQRFRIRPAPAGQRLPERIVGTGAIEHGRPDIVQEPVIEGVARFRGQRTEDGADGRPHVFPRRLADLDVDV